MSDCTYEEFILTFLHIHGLKYPVRCIIYLNNKMRLTVRVGGDMCLKKVETIKCKNTKWKLESIAAAAVDGITLIYKEVEE